MDGARKEEIRQHYCGNELKELRKICDPIIYKKGIPQMYHDDLYSDAMKVLEESLASYDEAKSSFHTYLTGNIRRSFYDWVRDSKRAKRCNFQRDGTGGIVRDENGKPVVVNDISMEAATVDGINLSEKIPDSHTVEDIIFSDENGISFDERVVKFLDGLTKTQSEILQLLMSGYSAKEIKKELGISDGEYTRSFKEIKSFDNLMMINRLFRSKCGGYRSKKMEGGCIKLDNFVNKANSDDVGMVADTVGRIQTAEKSKPKQYSIDSINKKIDARTIRFDHPLQRASEQWDPSMKGNLISDILQDNPLPELVFAEQIVNGIPIIWDLDGKQRCTNCYSFAHDGFKISKKIRRWEIEYLSQKRDDDGNLILDKNGFPTSEFRTFDIRGKKFSQLPSELQQKFLDYTFKCDQYLNCSSEDISYHIIRYNDGKNLTKPQKGIMRIGEDFAMMVKSISAMPFFRERGGYKVSEIKNGTIERVVVESVMAINYLDEWDKRQEVICEYLKDHASPEDFDNFEDIVTRINDVVTDEVADMFDSKDSFLYFGLFSKFIKMGKEDEKYVEFMAEMANSLHSRKIDGVSYDDLCINMETGRTRTTKDKSIVVQKMRLLERLLCDFLGVEMKEEADGFTEEAEETGKTERAEENCKEENDVDEEYITKFSDTDLMYGSNMSDSDIRSVAIDTLKMIDNNEEDALLYADCANEWLLEIKEDKGNIFTKSVLPAIIKFVKYIYDLDKPDSYGIKSLDKFLHSNLPSNDIQQNYIGMVACAA